MDWLLNSPAGLATRIAIGAAILTILAVVDLRRHGRRATRWREYAFLLACVVAAMGYGALNDQITAAISWEYFYYGKGLDEVLGPQTPPDRLALHLQAALVGLKATWSPGLLIGAAVLIANNPSRGRDRLPYRRLLRLLAPLLLGTAIIAAFCGGLGYCGLLRHMNSELALLWKNDLLRPQRFLAVYGLHLGGYIGGAVMAVVTVVRIRRWRKEQVTPVELSLADTAGKEETRQW
jgi:hypothetical protein